MTVTHTGGPPPDPRDPEWISTGQAAQLLGVSRQHIVDLCRAGDLAYALVGTHRRVRRDDVLALTAAPVRLTRDQRRSLWLGHAVAGRLVADPDRVLLQGRRNVQQMLSKDVRGSRRRWLGRWAELLTQGPDAVLVALTSTAPWARELRQNTPFAGVLSEQERDRVLAGLAGPA